MKKSLLLLFLALNCNLHAQGLEIGVSTTPSLGVGFGTFYDIRPMLCWGKSFNSKRRVRLDRTSMNLASYNGNTYFSMNTGLYFGQQWRKAVDDKFYFIHGPEVGTNYYQGSNYHSNTFSAHYRVGALFRVNDRFSITLESPISIQHSISVNGNDETSTSSALYVFNNSNLMSFTYTLK